MPENIATIAFISIMTGLWLWAMIRLLIKKFWSKHAPSISVPAVVYHKHIIETFDKYSGTGKHQKYVVVFSVEGEKKSFYVSEFSYRGYRINEKGTLTYKGDQLIEFR